MAVGEVAVSGIPTASQAMANRGEMGNPGIHPNLLQPNTFEGNPKSAIVELLWNSKLSSCGLALGQWKKMCHFGFIAWIQVGFHPIKIPFFN